MPYIQDFDTIYPRFADVGKPLLYYFTHGANCTNKSFLIRYLCWLSFPSWWCRGVSTLITVTMSFKGIMAHGLVVFLNSRVIVHLFIALLCMPNQNQQVAGHKK